MIHEVSIAQNNPPKGGVPLYMALTKHFQQGSAAARDVSVEEEVTTGAPAAMSTKTKNVTVSTTETVYAIGTSLTTPLPADSTSSLPFVFVTTSREPSTTVSGAQTAATHSESSSVTSGGVSTGVTCSGMAIVFMALAYVI